MEFRAEIKRTLTGPDKLRAVCSVILDDCFLVKNVRVVEGEKGMFVSLPSRRNVKGEWTEQCFPMTKELRAVVLAEYDRALAEDGGGTPAA
jgi:stage V sporulation protein G